MGDEMGQGRSVGAYETVIAECPYCAGDGEVMTADLFMGDGFTRCLYCGGSGDIEVCASCFDDGTAEGCSECRPAHSPGAPSPDTLTPLASPGSLPVCGPSGSTEGERG